MNLKGCEEKPACPTLRHYLAFPGRNEEHHDKSQSIFPVVCPISEPGTFRIRSGSENF
jgi:hypothetical protein